MKKLKGAEPFTPLNNGFAYRPSWALHHLFILALCFAPLSESTAMDVTPAYWELEDFEERFMVSRFPHGIDRQLFCSAVLLLNNKLRNFSCYFEEGDKVAEAMYAVLRVTLYGLERNRATLDGKMKSVRFGFSVKVDSTESEKQVYFSHSMDPMMEAANVQTIAPQRITSVRPSLSLYGCRFDISIWARVTVDKQGKARDVQFDKAKASEGCLDSIKEQLLRARYIPAQVDGDSVIGTYREYIKCAIKRYGCKLR